MGRTGKRVGVGRDGTMAWDRTLPEIGYGIDLCGNKCEGRLPPALAGQMQGMARRGARRADVGAARGLAFGKLHSFFPARRLAARALQVNAGSSHGMA